MLPLADDATALLELALLAAWRPRTILSTPDLPDCVLREHAGLTKRANSLLVLAPKVPARLSAATDWYLRRGMPGLSMLRHDASPPPELRPVPVPRVLVMTAQADLVADGESGASSTLTKMPPSSLIRRIARRADPGTPSQQAVDDALALLTSAPVQLFARTPGGGHGRLAITEVAGTAVIDGLFVPPEERRRGAATAMIKALAGAAHAHGASTVALEVEEDNAPAVTCYRRLGFSTVHSHRYFTPEPRRP
ncbi:GNAT family N-acetyltransferase [Actinomyces ruminis]|uniref:GNAT family N-acetyltransferase n=1 Tax=Actinomyces ruminis TaxID=1937003 RepID=UPI000B69C5F9|nr:GNAT family N-acetyltransferase [Actinomyces ruminis]